MKNRDPIFIFYSTFCDYSVEILELIEKYKLKDMFTFVCVDTVDNLPHIVDRVPMIITKNNDIICDDDIINFITNTYKKTLNSINALGNDQSSSFSFINENDDENEFQVRMYNYLDDDTGIDISLVTNIDTSKKNKIDQSEIEKYKRERDMDYQMLTSNM